MPLLLLLVIGIAVFSLTISHTDESGVTRNGLEGFLIYVIPDFKGLTLKSLVGVVMDAMGQLFFSLSVAMGIMITYGSYVRDDANLMKSINQIEIFDTVVAFLAGGIVVCLGYNKWYFELPLPNGTVAQILDIMDYISNNCLMPVVAIATCILIGWIIKPKFIIDEVEKTGCKFGRKGLYVVMIRFIAPVLLLILLLQSFI